jgi:hypothetical protein
MTDVYSFGILLAYLFTGSHTAEVPSGVQVRLCSRPHCSGTLTLYAWAPSQILSTERVNPRVAAPQQWFWHYRSCLVLRRDFKTVL